MKELYDLYWLALLVFLEARGESYKAKLAVAWVVLTRSNQKKLSIQDVIFQAWQFSALNTTDPNRMQIDSAPFTPVWNECLRAASAAYFAMEENPAPLANHYLNPKALKELPKWYKRNLIVAVIDRHEFLRVG